MPEIVLWDDADDKLLDQFENALDLAQTAIEDLPARPESRALDDVRQVASRIVVHESCDCWFDCYVMLLIAGTLYRLLVEFKPCFPIELNRLDWLSRVISGLLRVRMYSKDQARVLGPNFHGKPRDEWPDGASILVSTDEKLLLVNRVTLAPSFGASPALAENFLRNFDPRNPYPSVVWLTTREPRNYLVVDVCDEIYVLVFEAGGTFLEARVYAPTRTTDVNIASLGRVRHAAPAAHDAHELRRDRAHCLRVAVCGRGVAQILRHELALAHSLLDALALARLRRCRGRESADRAREICTQRRGAEAAPSRALRARRLRGAVVRVATGRLVRRARGGSGRVGRRLHRRRVNAAQHFEQANARSDIAVREGRAHEPLESRVDRTMRAKRSRVSLDVAHHLETRAQNMIFSGARSRCQARSRRASPQRVGGPS